MRRALAIGAAILLTTAFVLAQEHNNATEKTVRTDLTLSVPTRVGTTVLKAGEYHVMCDRTTITFQNAEGGKPLKMPCKGKELSAPAATTSVYTSKDASGVEFVQKLLIKGSTVEHVFD